MINGEYPDRSAGVIQFLITTARIFVIANNIDRFMTKASKRPIDKNVQLALRICL
jgi:large-conductance mechanosensitive channel